jgi:hypothetical protein
VSRATVIIRTDADRKKVATWAQNVQPGSRVEFKAPRRSLDQNSNLWACLTDVAHQVDWYGQKLTAEDWKDVFSAALRKARVVPGIDGGFVPLGMRTSDMSKGEMSALIELIHAFGAERGVKFGDEDF